MSAEEQAPKTRRGACLAYGHEWIYYLIPEPFTVHVAPVRDVNKVVTKTYRRCKRCGEHEPRHPRIRHRGRRRR